MDITYRLAKFEDLEEAERVAQDAGNELRVRHGARPSPAPPSVAFPKCCLAEDPDGLWVAERGDTMVGFGFSWKRRDAPSRNISPSSTMRRSVAASEVTPKFIAPADPATRWTAAHRGPAFFAYSANYLVDADHAIIVDVEATTAIRQAEILAAKRMVERSFEQFPERLIGDSAYGSAESGHAAILKSVSDRV